MHMNVTVAVLHAQQVIVALHRHMGSGVLFPVMMLLIPCWARHYELTQEYKVAFQGSHLHLARLVLYV